MFPAASDSRRGLRPARASRNASTMARGVTRCKRCKGQRRPPRPALSFRESRVKVSKEARMKRPIAILLGLALMAGAGTVLARGGSGGGGHGGSHGGSAGHHGGGFGVGVHTGFHGGDHGGRPFIGVRPGPVIVGRPPFFHRRPVVVSSTIVVGPPFFYDPPVYAAPVYTVPAYQDPPAYIEQGSEVLYY